MKKIIMIMMALVLCTSLASAVWEGLGSGTQNDPYQISNCTLLQNMSNYLDKYYVLTGDIDCSATNTWRSGKGFDPVGTTASPFTGELQGEGYIISNLFINDSVTTNNIGLFGGVDNIVINNLKLTDFYIFASLNKFNGGLAGVTKGVSYYTNLYVNGTFIDNNGQIGGIIGGGEGTVVDYAYLYNVTSDIIILEADDGYEIGGIFGEFPRGACYYCNSKLYINDSGSYDYGNVGGIAGWVGNGVIVQSKVELFLNNASYSVGGIVGSVDGTLNITNSYVIGEIVIDSSSTEIGGLVGYVSDVLISNSYVNLSITGSDLADVNCDVGYISGSVDIEGTYYNSDLCNKGEGDDITPLTDSQFKQSSNFPTFDFTSTWIMVNDYTYPELLYFWEHGSVIVYKFYDMVTGQLINNTNMTIMTDGNIVYYENNTVNQSEIVVWNLPADNYTLSVIAEGYEFSQYNVELGDADILYLNMYLLNSDDSGGATAFRVRDKNTGNPIYQASVDVYRKVFGLVWTKVASYKSDIIGKVQFSYLPYKSYRFVVSHTGYVTQDFIINPITQTLYTINLEPDGSLPLAERGVSYVDTDFYDGVNQTFSARFYSTEADLTSYTLKVTYPGGSDLVSGSTSSGSVLTADVNITGANLYDLVYIEMNYTTGGETKTQRIAKYVIISPSDYSISRNRANTYGLGYFERVLISTMIIMAVAGVGMVSIGTIASGALGLIVAGFLAVIGFLPPLIAIPLIVGFVVIAWRTSQ
jgi:hypothetical protein